MVENGKTNSGICSGMIFQKGEKMRTRFRCLEVNTNRQYYVSGLAEVIQIENNDRETGK